MAGRAVRRDVGFGNRLKEAMARRGIPASKLATDLGVYPQTVSRWRKGELPDDLRLPQIADYLRIGLDWLKTGVGEIEPQAQTPATRSPGRRKEDQAAFWVILDRRLAFLRDTLRAYAVNGQPLPPAVAEELLLATADAMDATRLSDAPARNGTQPAGPPPEP